MPEQLQNTLLSVPIDGVNVIMVFDVADVPVTVITPFELFIAPALTSPPVETVMPEIQLLAKLPLVQTPSEIGVFTADAANMSSVTLARIV